MTPGTLLSSATARGAYTVGGGSDADARIERDVGRLRELLRDAFPQARAAFLVGGYGRGEGGVHVGPKGPEPFNDYDLLLVFDRLGPLERRRVRRRVAALLPALEAAAGVPVDVGVQDRAGLANAPLSILWYEMAAGHRLLWGDAGVRFPRFDPAALPLDEAILLLTNRGSSALLRSHRRGAPGPATQVTPQNATDAMKLVLAWGDALLLRARRYTVSYVERLARLHELGGDLGPFGEDLPRLYARAVEFKLTPRLEEVSPADLAAALQRHAGFLAWFESDRLGTAVEDWTAYARRPARKLELRASPSRMLAKHTLRLGPPWDSDNLRLHARPTYERLVSVLPLLLFGGEPEWGEAARLLNARAAPTETWRSAAGVYLRLWK